MTHIVTIYVKGKMRPLCTIECSKQLTTLFREQMKDENVTVIELGNLIILKEQIKYASIN